MSKPSSLLWLSSLVPDFDESQLLHGLSRYEVVITHSLSEALKTLETTTVDAVWGNFSAKDEQGPLELMGAIVEAGIQIPIFIRQREAEVSTAVTLTKMGLMQLFTSSIDIEDALFQVELAVEDFQAKTRMEAATQQKQPSWKQFLIGSSKPMQKIGELVQLVAARRCTILISGETGTGKEVVAKAIHMASPRAHVPMVAINCSAIPEHLLEAELFGYVRGAFTGAQQLRIGRFEQAHGSTLFLDEIGDMPLDLQAKLLRVLQEREIQRLGSSETIKVDVRIVAASNADLVAKVRAGLFREDLYYRLNVVPLQMPPLRARPHDVWELAEHFVKKICHSEGLPKKTISMDAVRKLQSYSWPGNVRQLENLVEMAVVLSGNCETLLPIHFSLPESEIADSHPTSSLPVALPDHGLNFQETISQFERSILSQALRKTGGNKKLAADMLHLKRTTLSAKVRLLEAEAGYALV